MIRFLPVTALLLVATCVHAQGVVRPDDRAALLGIVDTVIVTGNDETRSYVILDEMVLRRGVPVTRAAIEYDRNRIYSLGLFNNVEILFDTAGGRNALFVDVHERWYLIPVLLFGFREEDAKKIYFGGGLLHNNVGGRNQKLFGSVVFGYNPSLDFLFSNPLIDREHQLYFAGRLSFSRIRNRSELAAATAGEFDEKHFDINATLGKRFSLYQTLGLNLGYQIVTVDEYLPGRTNSPTGKDHVPYVRLDYSYDARDLREYPTRGPFVAFYAAWFGFGRSDVDHGRFGTDLRTYVSLPASLTLALRAHGTIATGGTVPLYNHVYFGYGERLRGYYRTVFEGENLAGAGAELRYPLLAARTIFVKLPLLPREFSAWRFGIGLSLFGDTGAAWFRGDPVQIASFSSGYGAGVDFILPYSLVVRLQYARNDLGAGQYILDIRGAL